MVRFKNQEHEKPFMGSFANIRNSGGNMNARKYLISSVLIIFVILALVAPVTAAVGYSVSVQSYGSGSSSSLSSGKAALLQDYSSSKYTPSISTSTHTSGKTSAISSIFANAASPSKGTVSAFSTYKGIQQNEDGSTSYIEFSQRVSVDGDIYSFDFSTIFS